MVAHSARRDDFIQDVNSWADAVKWGNKMDGDEAKWQEEPKPFFECA